MVSDIDSVLIRHDVSYIHDFPMSERPLVTCDQRLTSVAERRMRQFLKLSRILHSQRKENFCSVTKSVTLPSQLKLCLVHVVLCLTPIWMLCQIMPLKGTIAYELNFVINMVLTTKMQFIGYDNNGLLPTNYAYNNGI